MKIAILTPSRGRPENMRRLFRSAKETAAQPNFVQIWLAVDWEDPTREGYLHAEDLSGRTSDICWTSFFGNAVNAWNSLYRGSAAEIVMMGADDIVFETKGWDDRFRDELAKDPLQVLYYKDNFRDEAQACNPVTTRQFFRKAGLPFYIYPELRHMYADTWIEDIAKRAGKLKYLPDVTIPQLHFKNGMAPMDATYARVRHEGYLEYAKGVWGRTTEMRAEAARKLLEP